MALAGSTTFWLWRRRGSARRREPAWSGGFSPPPPWLPFGDPATQIGAVSFAEPIRRILGPCLALRGATDRLGTSFVRLHADCAAPPGWRADLAFAGRSQPRLQCWCSRLPSGWRLHEPRGRLGGTGAARRADAGIGTDIDRRHHSGAGAARRAGWAALAAALAGSRTTSSQTACDGRERLRGLRHGTIALGCLGRHRGGAGAVLRAGNGVCPIRRPAGHHRTTGSLTLLDRARWHGCRDRARGNGCKPRD